MSSASTAFFNYLYPRRLLIATLAAGAVFMGMLGPVARRSNEAAALATLLKDDGLILDHASVRWLRPGHARFGRSQVLFLAKERQGLRDVYAATAHRNGHGGVWGVGRLRNLTRTNSADEQSLTLGHGHALYASKVGRFYDALTLLDLKGEPTAWTVDWPWYARLQNAITNIQEDGRPEGFGRTRLQIQPEAATLHIQPSTTQFVVTLDSEHIAIRPTQATPSHPRLVARPTAKGQPGIITWAVDTVRKVSWIGPAPIEWLEHRVFTVKDWFERGYYAIAGSQTGQEAALDLGVVAGRRVLPGDANLDIGWPPPTLKPMLNPPVEGEGKWIAVADDPFVKTFPNAPVPFYQTFVRADPERRFARVYITLWDPRQVQLHIVMGTKEPESATGETGSGMIPRDPTTLHHLVGGFNGGFQALHGEFGMMAERRVYIPPKPWAATVAVFDDASVGMGSWPAPSQDERAYDEQSATQQIPADMIAMRQNLTSVVEDGVWNPWQRWWWGAAPVQANEQTYIDRSGLCLTNEGFFAFFWGQSMGAEALGQAMLQARCARGLHLDMNSKHTGFEFYNVFAPQQSRPPLSQALDDAMAEMPVPDAPGYVVRSRKAVRTMGTMRFPRWIRRDPRDFFYLTLKPTLPGPDMHFDDAPTVRFSTSGLPQPPWPHAFARACVPINQTACTWIVRIDPKRLVFENAKGPNEKLLGYINLLHDENKVNSRYGLVAIRELLGWKYIIGSVPSQAGQGRLVMAAPALSTNPRARSGLGIDADGFWVLIQRDVRDQMPLRTRFKQIGIGDALALADADMVFRTPSGMVSVSGRPAAGEPSSQALALVANQQRPAKVLYPDNTPLPYSRWGYAQGRRVRYFPEGPPRFRAPGMQNN